MNTNTSIGPVFCRDCAYIGTNPSGDAARYKCFAPQNTGGYDLVTGDKKYIYVTCYEARAEQADRCTADGDWFLQAPPKPAYIAPIPQVTPNKSGMDLTIDSTQLATSQDVAKERMRLLLASRKTPAKAATNLLELL
jgi:hypothetical protein